MRAAPGLKLPYVIAPNYCRTLFFAGVVNGPLREIKQHGRQDQDENKQHHRQHGGIAHFAEDKRLAVKVQIVKHHSSLRIATGSSDQEGRNEVLESTNDAQSHVIENHRADHRAVDSPKASTP